MEGVSTLKQLWEKNDYAISWDLKEAYNHVPVHESLQPMLGIAHEGKIYKYVGMPFGLNDAPRVFSEIMKKVVKAIRRAWNVKAVVYLDDLLLLHQDPDHLRRIQGEITRFLQWLGWTVNLEKSNLEPSQIFKYLGWQWDSRDLTVRLTKERREKALKSLMLLRKKVYRTEWVTNRGLAKVIGILNAARNQFPMASLYLTKLHKSLKMAVNEEGWNGKCRLNPNVLGELKIWNKWIKENIPNELKKPEVPQAIVTTDAAPSGWGATLSFVTKSPSNPQERQEM
jgi:hypothetical protein